MKNKQQKTGNRPAYSKRIGNVRVTVWENDNEGQTYFNSSLVRRYRDGEDWKETNNLNGLADVTAALFALNAAAAFISSREDESSQQENDGEA